MTELPILSRRQMLQRFAGGCGSLALASLLAEEGRAKEPLAARPPEIKARAKRVIFLFMNGGVSHVESFDPKDSLYRDAGKTVKIDNWQGKKGDYNFFFKRPHVRFQPGGKSGLPVSDWFPFIREVADELCVIRSMKTDHTNHYESALGMHTGSWSFARPSLGSWVSYGLGTENRNLPSFLVITPSPPYAGGQAWGSDFLPGSHQGQWLRPGPKPIPNLRRLSPTEELQRLELDFLAKANRSHSEQRPGEKALEARIQSFETAFGMQREAPRVLDLSKESEETLKLYGLKRGQNTGFAWQCLIARRFAERNVRFIELVHSNWDSHGDMEAHKPLAKAVDQPIAALIKDLKRRGMLEDTLVVWTTEFGRTPYHAQKEAKGREHHHQVFSTFLAGGGVKAGFAYGSSDDYGIDVAENEMHVHDFHATLLHLLGLDHENLTFRHAGRDYRLTDVHGRVAQAILA